MVTIEVDHKKKLIKLSVLKKKLALWANITLSANVSATQIYLLFIAF